MPSPVMEMAAALLRQRRETADRLGLTLLQRRAAMEANARVLLAATDIDVEPVTLGGVPCERLNAGAGGGALIYLHGGGYGVGSPRTHRELAGRIARAADRTAVVPDYALAPERPFPAALEDAEAVYRAVVDQTGHPPCLVGDSAGGGLAMALIQRLKGAALPAPPRVAVLSPWTDLRMTGASIRDRAARDPYMTLAVLTEFADAYAAPGQRDDPLVSPLHADLCGWPPLLIQVGSEEILFDDAARLADRARAAGVAVTFEIGDGLFHVFQAVPGAPEALDATTRIGRFLAAGQP